VPGAERARFDDRVRVSTRRRPDHLHRFRIAADERAELALLGFLRRAADGASAMPDAALRQVGADAAGASGSDVVESTSTMPSRAPARRRSRRRPSPRPRPTRAGTGRRCPKRVRRRRRSRLPSRLSTRGRRPGCRLRCAAMVTDSRGAGCRRPRRGPMSPTPM
jgi:hypothetical protein